MTEEKMYEVNWHYSNDLLTHATVTTIRVERRGVLPGCTGESISAYDADGRKFQGSPDNYFNTERDAWDNIVADLKQQVLDGEATMAEVKAQTDAVRVYLETLKGA